MDMKKTNCLIINFASMSNKFPRVIPADYCYNLSCLDSNKYEANLYCQRARFGLSYLYVLTSLMVTKRVKNV